jgi:outer membrane protein assembly factor BamB
MSGPNPSTADQSAASPPASTKSKRGRWKIGAAIFLIASVAQSILWTMWWEDPTHFKMSILFVWPAAIFSLLIWWTFFSGWSAKVRYGLIGLGVVGIVAFFSVFRPDRFDGDMVPTRLTYRWQPSADQKAKEYLEQLQPGTLGTPADVAETKPLVADEQDWPGFRGPNRLGVLRDVRLRTDWAANPPKELWRHPVGHSWSSFAVIGDYAFTQEQRGNKEVVVAYHLNTGEQIWAHTDDAYFSVTEVQGGGGPRSTPQFSEGKLYTLGATGILNCLDARTGQRDWTTNILQDAGSDGKPGANLEWGMSGSPLVVDQFVIVIPGGKDGKSIAAYDRSTGKKIWSAGDQPATYASPTLATLRGERVVLAPLGTGLSANALESGKQLWFFPWTNAPKVCGAMPVALDEQSVLYGIGYGEGTVRLEVEKGDNWSVTKKWQSNRFRPKFNDFVIRDGYAYGLDDGTLSCLNIESGKVVWKAGRYGYGQILLVNDMLLVVSEKGEVLQIPAEPSKPDIVATFTALDEAAITWNQPVLVRGKLLVRNANEAACFDLE